MEEYKKTGTPKPTRQIASPAHHFTYLPTKLPAILYVAVTMLFNLNSSMAIAAAFTAVSNAAIVDLFHDDFCTDPAGQRNVWDNTCAPSQSFSSFVVVFATQQAGQHIHSYSTNNCAVPTGCDVAWGALTGWCILAKNFDGGSNSLGSWNVNC